MNVMIVLCHPRKESFNHATAERVRRTLLASGYDAGWHDLYRDEFDPVLREEELRSRFSFDENVQRYWQELERSEGLVIVHPDWWGQPPALLKGWVDRVFRPGIAYEHEGEEFADKQRRGLLAGKKGLVLCTTDADAGTGTSPPTPSYRGLLPTTATPARERVGWGGRGRLRGTAGSAERHYRVG